jgi:putative hydrolase of the HAD superfamily
LDDTLLDFSRAEHEGILEIFRLYGVKEIDLDKVIATYQEINKQVWIDIENGGNLKELLNTRFSTTLLTYGIYVNGRQLESEYRYMLDHSYYVLDGAEKLLNCLIDRGYDLFVASNGRANTQISRLVNSKLYDKFKGIYISENIGFSKPSNEFFEYIFKDNVDITAQNSIMIGDRLSSDIKGANNVFMNNILYNPNNIKNTTNIEPLTVVSNYNQIYNIIIEN